MEGGKGREEEKYLDSETTHASRPLHQDRHTRLQRRGSEEQCIHGGSARCGEGGELFEAQMCGSGNDVRVRHTASTCLACLAKYCLGLRLRFLPLHLRRALLEYEFCSCPMLNFFRVLSF